MIRRLSIPLFTRRATRDGMLDNKVIDMSQTKKTALAANLTPEQIRQAVDRADKWIQAQ